MKGFVSVIKACNPSIKCLEVLPQTHSNLHRLPCWEETRTRTEIKITRIMSIDLLNLLSMLVRAMYIWQGWQGLPFPRVIDRPLHGKFSFWRPRLLSVPFLIRTSGISQPSRLGYGDPNWGGCIVYDQCTLTKFVSSACMFCIADECHQNDVKRFSISWRLLPSPCINWQCISGDKVSWLNSNIVHVCNYRKIWCKIPFLHFFIQEREVFFRDQHDRHPNPNHFHSLLQERVLCWERPFYSLGRKKSIWSEDLCTRL